MIKSKAKVLFFGSLILFVVAAFCQFYESRYFGWDFPVITHPLQAYALPLALIGVGPNSPSPSPSKNFS